MSLDVKLKSASPSPVVRFMPPETEAPGFAVELGNTAALASPFSFSRFYLDPGCSSVAEAHREAEIWFFASGPGKLYIDGELYLADKGSSFFFAPNVEHELRNSGENRIEVFSVWWNAED